MKKLGIVGCKHTTMEFMSALLRHGVSIDHCLTLSPELGAKEAVAGYKDLRGFLADKNIPFTLAASYSLRNEADRTRLLALGLDLLLVIGWQRLIPSWLLDSLSVGAFGMHGSSRHLPYGRGRSPMNWSLIQNKSAFFTHLFRYEPGVDDGNVVGYRAFDITPFDTALTLHYKNTVAMIQLVIERLPSLLDGTAVYTAQDTQGATYYPKRGEDDGLIFWTDATLDIYNLIRAVTKPFPGAFTYVHGNPGLKLTVWRAIPFDSQLTFPTAGPGEIVEVLGEGHFIVRTGTTSLLVLDYEGIKLTPEDVGRVLSHGKAVRRLYENIPL